MVAIIAVVGVVLVLALGLLAYLANGTRIRNGRGPRVAVENRAQSEEHRAPGIN